MKLGTAAAGSTIQLLATFNDTTTQTFTFSPTSNYGVFTFTLTSGKTINSFKWLNQSGSGTFLIDYLLATYKSIVITRHYILLIPFDMQPID